MQIVTDPQWALDLRIEDLAQAEMDNLEIRFEQLQTVRGCLPSCGVRKLVDELDSKYMLAEIFNYQESAILMMRGLPARENILNGKIFHQIKTRWGASSQEWVFTRIENSIWMYFISQTRGKICIRKLDSLGDHYLKRMDRFGFFSGLSIRFWCMYDLGDSKLIAPIITLPCEA